MKIAILLFGQPRFFDLTKDLIKQEFDLPGHDVHYFAHFWDHLGYVPHGEEESYDTPALYDNIYESLPEVKSILIQSYDQEDSCSNLKDVCEHMLYFTHKLHSRKIPCGKNINNLYYKFGQHWSMKRCFDRIQKYEADR